MDIGPQQAPVFIEPLQDPVPGSPSPLPEQPAVPEPAAPEGPAPVEEPVPA